MSVQLALVMTAKSPDSPGNHKRPVDCEAGFGTIISARKNYSSNIQYTVHIINTVTQRRNNTYTTYNTLMLKIY